MADIDVFKQLGESLQVPLTISTPTPSATFVPLTLSTPTPSPITISFDDMRGTATLSGTTKNLGIPNQPVSRRVQLIEERSGRVLREVWSDPATGVYTFSEIQPQVKFSVVAYDHTGNFRAVIADNLEATL